MCDVKAYQVVFVFFKLLFKLLDFLLEILKFLGELLTHAISLCTFFRAERGTTRPEEHKWINLDVATQISTENDSVFDMDAGFTSRWTELCLMRWNPAAENADCSRSPVNDVPAAAGHLHPMAAAACDLPMETAGPLRTRFPPAMT